MGQSSTRHEREERLYNEERDEEQAAMSRKRARSQGGTVGEGEKGGYLPEKSSDRGERATMLLGTILSEVCQCRMERHRQKGRDTFSLGGGVRRAGNPTA